MNEVGAALKALRRAQGMTRASVAAAFDVSSATVWRWELGHTPVSMERVDQLLDHYRATAAERLVVLGPLMLTGGPDADA